MFSLTRFVRTFFFRMQLKLFENDIIRVHFGFARKIESYMRIRTVNIYIYIFDNLGSRAVNSKWKISNWPLD